MDGKKLELINLKFPMLWSSLLPNTSPFQYRKLRGNLSSNLLFVMQIERWQTHTQEPLHLQSLSTSTPPKLLSCRYHQE